MTSEDFEFLHLMFFAVCMVLGLVSIIFWD